MSGDLEGEPGYPHHLAGDPAPAPRTPAAKTYEMAQRAADRHPAEPARGAVPHRIARAIAVLFEEANAAAPNRRTSSDGTIGDARHAALGRATDHNPWLVDNHGVGVVRAGDLTNDPALNLAAAFERARIAAAAGRLPQVLNGGYLILNGRITAPDWSGWREYKGTNPHVLHGHVSVSLNPAQFDSPKPWGIFAPAPARPVPSPGWSGPDLRGAGTDLRGEQGNSGPRVQAWQAWLADYYPAYRHTCGDLVPDGEWGPITSRWNAEFGHRSAIPSADGTNIGPKLAAAYFRAGLFRTRSAAQLRAAGHIRRPARR